MFAPRAFNVSGRGCYPCDMADSELGVFGNESFKDLKKEQKRLESLCKRPPSNAGKFSGKSGRQIFADRLVRLRPFLLDAMIRDVAL